MKQIKAVISDLDGTLLNGMHALSDITVETVRALEEKGILFVIATGRHFMDVLAIKETLGVSPYMITANGATVCDHTGSIMHEAIIERETVEAIMALDVPKSVYRNMYQGELWLMERESKIFDAYYKEGDFNYTVCKFEDRFHMPTNKMFFTSDVPEDLIPIYEHIKQHYSDVVDTTFSLPKVLEVMAKGINKGKALESVLSLHGIDFSECIAFGDGLNDLEMLGAVGRGYIMGNADEKLKEELPKLKVIGANHEDAVANKIKSIFKI